MEMPINLDAESLDEVEKREGGKGLRRLLEDTIAERNALSGEVSTLRAAQVIQAKGLNLVKAEELSGVDPKLLEAKAEELQAQKVAERRQVVKEALEAKGLEGDELEAAVDDLITPASASVDNTIEDMLDTSRTPGTRIASTDADKDLHGAAALESYFAAQEKKKKR